MIQAILVTFSLLMVINVTSLTTLVPLPLWPAIPTGAWGALGWSGELLPVPGTEPPFDLSQVMKLVKEAVRLNI